MAPLAEFERGHSPSTATIGERGRAMKTRWLARLLVLLLCPVLVIVSQGVAEAAVQYGPRVDVTIEGEERTPFPGDSMSCNFSGYWGASTGGVVNVTMSTDCETGWAVNVSAFSFSVSGVNAGGQFCEATFLDPPDADAAYTQTSSVDCGTDDSTAHIDTLCAIAVDEWGINHTYFDKCVSFDLGAAYSEAYAGQCIDGDVKTPIKEPTSLVHPHSWDKALWQAVTFAVKGKGAGAGPWTVYLYHSNGSREIFYSVPSGTAGTNTTTTQGAIVSATVDNPQPDPAPNNDIIGVGMWRPTRLDVNEATAWQGPRGAGGSSGSYVGITDPAHCAYYWGAKIASTSSDTKDDPTGALTGAPADPSPPGGTVTSPAGSDETGCGFDVFDPSTYVGAAMCELLHAIGALFGVVDAILSFLGGLMGLLGDLLSSLFVPSEGAFTDAIDGVQAEADTGDIGAWKDTATSAFDVSPGGGGSSGRVVPGGGSVPTSGGCAGPSFSWDKLGTVGLPTEIQPLYACSGTGATLAGWSHLLLTVLIGVGGVLKIAQMVFAGLGLVKQTNILTSNDWTSDRFS